MHGISDTVLRAPKLSAHTPQKTSRKSISKETFSRADNIQQKKDATEKSMLQFLQILDELQCSQSHDKQTINDLTKTFSLSFSRSKSLMRHQLLQIAVNRLVKLHPEAQRSILSSLKKDPKIITPKYEKELTTALNTYRNMKITL